MKKGNVRYVYPGGNTPEGFHSFYAEGLSGFEHVFILKGGPGTGKSTLMRKIGNDMAERGYDVELWQCSSDNNSLDGVLVPALSCAVVDGTAPHIVDPKYPGVVDEIVNLGDHWQPALLAEKKDDIIALTKENSAFFAQAYENLARAKSSFEACTRELMDEPLSLEINACSADLVDSIFCRQDARVRHYFASAFTPQGWVGFVQSLSQDYAVRYVVEAPTSAIAGEILSRVAQAAQSRGHAVEIYHHPMDLSCVELLLLPQLQVALVASGARGLVRSDKDIIVSIAADKSAAPYEAEWQRLMDEGCACIAKAKEVHDKLESCYIRAMDFAAIDEVQYELFNRIWSIAAQKER